MSGFPTCSQCGSRNLAFDSEVVCQRCGAVQKVLTAEAYSVVSEEMQKASSNTHYHPRDPLKIKDMGEQHDMTSPKNMGKAMELGVGTRAKDYAKKKVEPQLFFGYVTGQVVGKGSRVEEKIIWDITLECGHSMENFTTKPTDHVFQCQQCQGRFAKASMPIFALECFIFKYVAEIRHYRIPVAVKDFTDDTIYRNAMTAANDIGSKLQFGDVERRYYGLVMKREFSDFVNVVGDLLAIKALKKLAITHQGLGLQVAVYDPKYDELLEKMRSFLFEVVTEGERPMPELTK